MTLKEIAEQAGVSIMTVSNVLNGKSSRTSEATRQKVLEIAKKNKYEPNFQAKSLASKTSKIIAVILYSINGDDPFQSPYNAIALGVITKYAQENGYYLMIRVIKNLDEIAGLLKRWNVDGALMMGIYSRDLPVITTEVSTPMVFTDTYSDSCSEKEYKFTNVGIDDYMGGYIAGSHLVSMGHSNIAFVGMDIKLNISSYQRFLGFRDSLSAHNILFNPDNFYTADVSYKDGSEVGRRIARNSGITAIFAATDVIAIGIMSGLRSSGKNIPDDISIVGFDGLDIGTYAYPPLTTIRQDISQKMSIAMSYLIQKINTPDLFPQNVVLDVSLIEGGTVKNLHN